jgi:hypothetical protein
MIMVDMSDTPAGSISRLDGSLARRGEDVVLTRMVKIAGSMVAVSVTCRASVRAVKATELDDNMKLTDLALVISPTQILAANWPGVDELTPSGSGVDQHVPRITDQISVQGKSGNIVLVKPIRLAGTWVRCDLVVSV